MHTRSARPGPEDFSSIPKKRSAETPQRCHAHNQHERRYKAVCNAPIRDESRQTIAPEVLHHRDLNKDGASHWLI